MTITASISAELIPAPRIRQNWVLTPLQDTLFIIAAPLIVLAVALWAFARFGAAEATALIIVAHIIMTVAHHLPTFIRIYGDVDLFRRFKWNFVVAPVVPMIFSVGVLSYINAHDYPVDYFLYLYIVLALWDPWHFLRQHYGFMRIYDRPNAAPSEWSAKMDWWLCVSWFVHIMLASGAWLRGLLQDMYANAGIGAILYASADTLEWLSNVTALMAAFTTIAYVVYLAWCWSRHYFISGAKLALLIVTFGVMLLTYTPNAWIESLAPGWTFKVGFATVGIVHMTQYLAIVWRYNRSLASSSTRSRAGLFRWWHGKGKAMAWLFGGAYVGVCLLYGDVLTTQHESRWLMSGLLAVGFTSTLLHYYFDGFIWKVRHQQNREALALSDNRRDENTGSLSWWTSAKQMTAGHMFVRQLLYFGLPMTLLTVGAVAAWNAPATPYAEHMYRAQSLSQQGDRAAAIAQAQLAYASMNRQLPFAAKMAELEPTSAREAELAFLIYNQSLYENVVMPQVDGKAVDAAAVRKHRERVGEAVQLLSSAIDRGGSLAHASRNGMTRADAVEVRESWRRIVK